MASVNNPESGGTSAMAAVSSFFPERLIKRRRDGVHYSSSTIPSNSEIVDPTPYETASPGLDFKNSKRQVRAGVLGCARTWPYASRPT